MKTPIEIVSDDQLTIESMARQEKLLRSEYNELSARYITACKALERCRDWGVSSRGFSASEAAKMAAWIDGGMKGEPEPVPSYYL